MSLKRSTLTGMPIAIRGRKAASSPCPIRISAHIKATSTTSEMASAVTWTIRASRRAAIRTWRSAPTRSFNGVAVDTRVSIWIARIITVAANNRAVSADPIAAKIVAHSAIVSACGRYSRHARRATWWRSIMRVGQVPDRAA